MDRAWLLDGRGIAKKVKHASCSSVQIPEGGGAFRECPNCHYRIDNSDVSPLWPGFPFGVKFDPSDSEILDHLAGKCGVGNSEQHPFIDVFIQTLEEDHGICYTHPENLPDAKKNGSSIHFFHRSTNAYATGQRKRRKVQHNSNEEHVRWHKTGKTKPVLENGVHKGWKKIMVLYTGSKKGCKPEKSNWVMHQYHLGAEEDEHDGEYVVSKVFYQQQKQADKNDDKLLIEASPRTPNTIPPNPSRPYKSMAEDDLDENMQQEADFAAEASHVLPHDVQYVDNLEYTNCLAGESQTAEDPDMNCMDVSLLCNEIFNSSSLLKDEYTNCAHSKNEVPGNNDASSGFPELENLEVDTPPDIPLADLQFGSQESLFSWMDRLT